MDNQKTLPLIIKMAIPPTISMLIQSLYNLVDSIYITRYDELAMEAISLVFPIQNIILAISVGISIGINAFVARKLGEKKLNDAKNCASLGLYLSILHYLIVLIVGLIISPFFLRSFTTNEVVINYGITYINYIIIFSFTTLIMIALEKVLQAQGKMNLPMIALLAGSVTNIILDPIFIFTFKMGIKGAAIATCLGQVLSLGMMIYFIASKNNQVRIQFKSFKFDKSALKSIYLVGIPSVFLVAIPSLMVGFMNYILVGINDLAVSTFGIYYKLQFFVYMAVSGLSQGIMPLLSYLYGASNHEKFSLVIKDSVLISISLGLLFNLLFLIIPGPLIKLFYENPENLNYLTKLFRVASLSFVFGSFNYLIASYFQACQSGFKSLLVALLRQIIFLLPLAFILSKPLEELGVYLALPLAEFITTLIVLVIFITDYKKRINKMNLKDSV